MAVLSGVFGCAVDPNVVKKRWNERYGAEISAQADIEIAGRQFRIIHSENWPIVDLKPAFEVEFHKDYRDCIIFWS
jgi:hypothetical protein